MICFLTLYLLKGFLCIYISCAKLNGRMHLCKKYPSAFHINLFMIKKHIIHKIKYGLILLKILYFQLSYGKSEALPLQLYQSVDICFIRGNTIIDHQNNSFFEITTSLLYIRENRYIINFNKDFLIR